MTPTKNLQVPGDLKIIGYDDIQGAQLLNPPLTTIRQPVETMGAEALAIAIDALDGKLTEEKVVIHTPELILRGTA